MALRVPVVLASASSRRVELLSHLISSFECCPADIDESAHQNETPAALVQRLAQQKAQMVCNKYPDCAVIGSDTIIMVDGQALGKPNDLQHSQHLLQLLSDRWHHVLTAVCVIYKDESNALQQRDISVSTQVELVAITQQQIEQYWLTGEPQDKAGSYAIQGIGGQFVKQIKGSYSSVVGLPLAETRQLLVETRVII